MGVRDTLLADAESVENAGGPAGLLQLVKKECPDLPPSCIQGLIKKLLNDARKGKKTGRGAGSGAGGNKECAHKLTACVTKILPKLAAAKGPTQPK
ncbi:hypothetical protein LEL_03192 [Akanthomyces lecanii RCEF 1005]|uniref:Uncharacterized protein n=1 Tax=Akanthomyces lecanii RCEF 1005 TaxID=1081108 RepID=A0A168IVF5_CORDF|nr:hypothetical protein LEL_03192 [Akanthomyces lecanii RCEF 1005]